MKIILQLATLALLTTSFAHAVKPPAPAQPSSWPEPSTFLGLALGAPIAAQAALIACPKKPLYAGSTSLTRDYNDKRFCYEPSEYATNFLSVWNPPSLGFGYSATMVVRDGEVHGVLLRLTREGAPQLLEMLTTRFGQPTSVRVGEYQNKLGAQYSGKVFHWDGATVRMELAEIGERVNESSFELVTREAEAREKNEKNTKATQYKDRL